MDLDKAIEAIDRFFLDLIGTVVPGGTLLIGSWLLLAGPSSIGPISISMKFDTIGWVLLIFVSYVLGYAIISVGENIVIPVYDFTCGLLRKIGLLAWIVPHAVVSREALFNNLTFADRIPL